MQTRSQSKKAKFESIIEYKFNDSHSKRVVKRNFIVGKQGKKPGEFNCPSSVCFDNQNNQVIVCDSWNNRIQVFDSDTLQFHSMFGSHGNESNQFKYPYGICVQPFTGNLLVCDTGNNRIQIFNRNDCNRDSSYSFSYQIGSLTEYGSKEIGQFNSPFGICCDEKGHIIVADTHNHRIQEFNENGRFLYSFGLFGESFDQLKIPRNLCVDKEHHQLLITDFWNNRISIWSRDSDCQHINNINIKERCFSVCIDPLRNDQILVGTDHNIVVYDKRNLNSKSIQMVNGKEYGKELSVFNCVFGLCVNEDDGTLIAADYLNHRIQIF